MSSYVLLLEEITCLVEFLAGSKIASEMVIVKLRRYHGAIMCINTTYVLCRPLHPHTTATCMYTFTNPVSTIPPQSFHNRVRSVADPRGRKHLPCAWASSSAAQVPRSRSPPLRPSNDESNGQRTADMARKPIS